MKIFVPDFEIILLADRCRLKDVNPDKTTLGDDMVFRVKQYHRHDKGRKDAQEIVDLFPDEFPDLVRRRST